MQECHAPDPHIVQESTVIYDFFSIFSPSLLSKVSIIQQIFVDDICIPGAVTSIGNKMTGKTDMETFPQRAQSLLAEMDINLM